MATPDRPDPDDLVASTWGQWVQDRLLGDPIGIAGQPARTTLHTRAGTTALVSDGAARLTIPLPLAFPNTLLGAWATPNLQGAEARIYAWDPVASTKAQLVFLCYHVTEVAGAPQLGYSPNVGQYPAWFAIGD
jgi:hypothetical protein